VGGAGPSAGTGTAPSWREVEWEEDEGAEVCGLSCFRAFPLQEVASPPLCAVPVPQPLGKYPASAHLRAGQENK
jgi:hypothetical protein